jgi:hypothetical protein
VCLFRHICAGVFEVWGCSGWDLGVSLVRGDVGLSCERVWWSSVAGFGLVVVLRIGLVVEW